MAEKKAGKTGGTTTKDTGKTTANGGGGGKAETRVGRGTVSEVVEDTLPVGDDHPAPKGDHQEGQMDISDQVATFTGFVRMTTRVVIAIVVFLIFLALVGT